MMINNNISSLHYVQLFAQFFFFLDVICIYDYALHFYVRFSILL